MIRIDTIWLAVEPMDMRAGTETALARVVKVFGAAHPHHAYVFANGRANRIKVLIHDGFGVWLAARRLNTGSFVWPMPRPYASVDRRASVQCSPSLRSSARVTMASLREQARKMADDLRTLYRVHPLQFD